MGNIKMPLLCDSHAAMTPALCALLAPTPARAGLQGTGVFAAGAGNGIGGQIVVRERISSSGASHTGAVAVQRVDADAPVHNLKFADGVSRSAVRRPPV